MIRALLAFIYLPDSTAFKFHQDLVLENLALRQLLAVNKRQHKRLQLRPSDRLFWIWLSRIWGH